MSHSVTVTRTTTTTSSSAILLNVGYMTKPPGILKVLETVIGIICLSLIGYYTTGSGRPVFIANPASNMFFFLTTFAFLLGTLLLLVACVFNLTTATLIPKTLFELLYHVVAFIFYFCGSLAILIPTAEAKNSRKGAFARNLYFRDEEALDGVLAASVLGVVNSVLYLLSAILSFRSYRSN